MEEGYNQGTGADPNMQYPPYQQQMDPSTMHSPPYAYGTNDSEFAKRQRMYTSPPSYSNDGSAMDVAPTATMVDDDLEAWAQGAQGGDLAMMFRFSPSSGAPDNRQPVSMSETDTLVHRPAAEQPNMSIYTPIMMSGDKPNSTSSIFCRDTVLNPNADQIILCMSSVLHVQMLQDDGAGDDLKQRFGVFNDPVDTSMAATAREPGAPLQVTAEEIHQFIERMFKWAQFSTECNIIALVYINRIIALTNMPLHQGNWKAVVLVALMIAQKVWDDRGLSLSGFSVVCPEFSKERLKAMEMKFLELMQYRAVVTQGLYARYYFELRALFEQLLRQSHSTRSFPLKPLRLWEARKLELVSDAFGLNRHPNAATRVHRPSGLPPLAPSLSSNSEGGASTMDYTCLAPVPEESNYPGSGVMSCASSVRSDRSITMGNRVRQPTGLQLPPQSPGMTLEDVTVLSKGRFVQS